MEGENQTEINSKITGMKMHLLRFLVFGLTILITATCTKKKGCTDPVSYNYDADAEKDDGTCEYAGLGGNASIVAFPQHHGMPIFGSSAYPDSAYVKFNAIESPGTNTSVYDAVFAGDSAEDHVHLPGLKRGKYYILMSGWDSTIQRRVSGGVPYVLSQTSGEVDLIVPVVE